MLRPFTGAWPRWTGVIVALAACGTVLSRVRSEAHATSPAARRPTNTRQSSVRDIAAPRQPPLVTVRPERHSELPANLADEVRVEEVVSQPRHALTRRNHARDGTHELAVLVFVPVNEEPFTAVLPRFDAGWLRLHTLDV